MNTITTIHAALRGSARRIVFSLALALLAVSASAQTVGFTADTTAEQFGTYQNANGGLLNIGRQMTVTGAGIEVLQLGVFDYQSDGLAAAHTVTLFDSTQTPIASVTVPAGTSAPLINAFRFAPLGTPLFLPAGNYSILAYQMNASDPYGNGNAPGFNGGGNVSPGAGVYHFTSNPSPDYWTDTSGENFASVSFTYTNVPPATGIWTGGGVDNKWSTAGNWNGLPIFPSDLTFAGNTRLVNSNDNSGITVSKITFDAAAGAFTLSGNDITLSGNIGFSGVPATPVTQTINLSLATTGDITVGTRINGSIILNGNITGGNQLTQAGPDNAGVLTLGGTNSLKGFVVNNGTNIITGTTTINGIGGSSFFYVPDAGSSRNSTLIIQPGATLTVSGGFQDAAVIARDASNGKIIQNGGTFNFAINDGSHNYLFVGASTQPNAHAEYDMNGGLLDMNGDTLGIALGGSGQITGVVNQAGGVITNVLNLRFNPFVTGGIGSYNLTGGTIYIESGGITSDGGVYQMNLGGGTIAAEANWSSSLNMTLTGSNGPVTFNPTGNSIALSGALSGSGGLTVNGSGVLDLTGANTYTGDTLVTAGSTLQFDTTGTSFGAIKLANGSTLNLNYSGTRIAAAAYTNGVALSVGTYNAGNLPGFITGSGNLQVSSGISTGIWDGGGANNNWSSGGSRSNNHGRI